jgi:hypothetical protein
LRRSCCRPPVCLAAALLPSPVYRSCARVSCLIPLSSPKMHFVCQPTACHRVPSAAPHCVQTFAPPAWTRAAMRGGRRLLICCASAAGRQTGGSTRGSQYQLRGGGGAARRGAGPAAEGGRTASKMGALLLLEDQDGIQTRGWVCREGKRGGTGTGGEGESGRALRSLGQGGAAAPPPYRMPPPATLAAVAGPALVISGTPL